MRGEAPDGPRVNDPRFFSRMKGQGAWAELLRLRFQLAVRRLGLNRERVDLRSDLFVPPARGPVPAAGDSRRPARECEVPAQGSLFQTL